MSTAVYRRPPIVVLAAMALAMPLMACGTAARRQVRSTGTPPVLASTLPAVSGQGSPEGGASGLTVASAGDTLTFSATAYCKACSASIAQTVAALAGVQHAAADPSAATFRIVVQYEPGSANAERITGEVRSALVAYDLNKLVLHRTATGVELSSGRFT